MVTGAPIGADQIKKMLPFFGEAFFLMQGRAECEPVDAAPQDAFFSGLWYALIYILFCNFIRA